LFTRQCKISNLKSTKWFSKADHDGFEALLHLKDLDTSSVHMYSYLDYKNAFWPMIISEMTALDYSVSIEPEVSHAIDKWYSTMDKIIDTWIPKRSTRKFYSVPWFDTELNRIFKIKQELHKNWKKTGNQTSYLFYKSARETFKNAFRKKKACFFQEAATSNTTKNSKLWKILKLYNRKNLLAPIMISLIRPLLITLGKILPQQ